MKWLEKLSNNFARSLEAESQAYQAGFGAIGDAVSAVSEAELRPVRSALGDSPEEFTKEDVVIPRASVLGMNMSNPQEEMPNQRIPKELVNTGLDMALAPSNLFGAGLVTSGIRGAKRLAGANSGRGNALSSAPNYIPNFYGPSKTAQPTLVDEMIASRVPRFESPQQVADAREKVGSFVNWMGNSAVRGVDQVLNPSSRALYRETAINRTSQEAAKEALEKGGSRDIGKAVAQIQASDILIPDQAGRRGPVSPDVKNIEERSYLTEAVPIQQGSYTRLIKKNDLKGKYESGRNVGVADKDLKLIDEHVRTVWRDADGTSIGNSPGSHIRIKNAGAGDQVTGAHHADFATKSTVLTSLRPLFKSGKNATVPQLHAFIKNLDNSKIRLHPKSKTLEDAQENGLWITGSFVGNAVTEGGVNYIAKVNPNGRVMAVISDEHNFLEKTPVVGTVVSGGLPNRSLSVTPPMHFDIKKNKEKIKSAQPKKKVDVRESLRNIAEAKPSQNMLTQERKVNAGATTLGAGMLTGGNREEERR